jgi:hypothetical protein
MAHEYVLVTLRELPLHEEGIYRFRLALNGQTPAFVDVPALATTFAAPAEVH